MTFPLKNILSVCFYYLIKLIPHVYQSFSAQLLTHAFLPSKITPFPQIPMTHAAYIQIHFNRASSTPANRVKVILSPLLAFLQKEQCRRPVFLQAHNRISIAVQATGA
jgi:hypothetical protein